MISKLEAFLIEASKEVGEKEVNLSRRLKDATFRIRSLSFKDLKDIRRRCIIPGQSKSERVDDTEITLQTVLEGCVAPDFRNAEFLAACGCTTPTEAINKLLNAGEISNLSKKISEFSGFGDSLDETVEEAKN